MMKDAHVRSHRFDAAQGILRLFAFQPGSELPEVLTDPDEPSLGLLVAALAHRLTGGVYLRLANFCLSGCFSKPP
jgi:hypothetical protein